ncbi:hypothetical protein [Winogradskyella sp. 3972H.M.0a.05]|uniref:hypothetical protein n=1 Tax=Winogradskyella sp. 3972H.M.0a.05 TaxID=2950277 RepID=UPI003398BC4F
MNNQELDTINNLYKVFSPYTVIGDLSDRSCPCCIDRLDRKALFSKPLRELSEDDLGFYMRKAITTLGSVNDYKHFLPRILELVALSSEVKDDFIDFEKLNYGNWLSWKEEEVFAIKLFFTTLLKNALETNSKNMDDYILLNLIYNEDSLSETLLESDSERLIQNIIDYALNIGNNRIDERLANIYSDRRILDKIEHLFLNAKNKDEANRISIAYSILENKNDDA